MLRNLLRPTARPLIEQTLVDFKDKNLGLQNLLLRSDKDLGGFSTINLTEEETPQSSGEGPGSKYGVFKGNISLDLPKDRPEVVRLGYGMFRTKDLQPSFFGLGASEFLDLSNFSQIALRVKGDYRKYFLNVQASDEMSPTDLYQHRLSLKTPGSWEEVRVPFSRFVLTSSGVVQNKYGFDPAYVRSIGVAILDGQAGPFHLEVDYIKAIS